MSGPPPTPPGPLRHDPAPLPAPGPRPRPPHTGADPTSPWYRPPEPPPFPAATATAPEGDLGVGPGAANGTGGTPRRLGALLALIVSVPLAIGTVASALGSLARPTPATTESGRPEAVVSVVPTEPSTTAPNPDDDYPALSPARARTDALTGVLIPAGPARAMPPVPSDDGSRISLVERCRLVTWTTTAPKRGATSLEVPGRAGRCPAAVSDDGRYLVVVGESGLLLRGTSGTGTARLTGTAVPEAFRITEDGRRLVGLVEGTKLATWDLAHPGNDPDLVSLPSRPLQWQVGASGEVAGTLGKEGELNLWNLTTTDPLGTISPFLGSEPFAISPDGNTVAALTDQSLGEVVVFSTGAGPETIRVRARGRVDSIAFSVDGQYLALVGSKGAQVWETAGGDPVGPRFTLPKGLAEDVSTGLVPLSGARFSRDGSILVAWADTGQVVVWPTTDLRPAR